MPKLDAMHYAKKQELWALIRALGRLYGETEEGVRVFAKECYEAHMDDLDVAVECFRDLVKGSQYMKHQKSKTFKSHAEYSANEKD